MGKYISPRKELALPSLPVETHILHFSLPLINTTKMIKMPYIAPTHTAEPQAGPNILPLTHYNLGH